MKQTNATESTKISIIDQFTENLILLHANEFLAWFEQPLKSSWLVKLSRRNGEYLPLNIRG